MKEKLAPIFGIFTIYFAFFGSLARAEDINFNAVVANSCTVTKLTDGTMLYDTTEYDFNEGTPGTFTVLNTAPGGTVTITPPSNFSTKPGDYTGTPNFSYRYSFIGTNTIAEVTISDGSSDIINFALPGLNTGTLHSSATTSSGGFTSGNYTAVYTVTCS
ncbi:hypothetical protein ACSYAD_24000 [Acaryochloris marina NIES-2412]|uniref:hypothetical protein n=1 Tax=Acaryochloris marina TaxID=155978 RepID=UPI0040597E1B